MKKEGEKVFVSNVYEGLPGSDGSVHFFQSQRCFSAAPPKNYFCKDLSVFCSPSTFSHNNNKKVFSFFSQFSPFSHSYKLLLFFLSSNTPIFLSKSVSSFFFPSSFSPFSKSLVLVTSSFQSLPLSFNLEANFLVTFTLFFFPYTRALFLPFLQFILVPFVPF